jgi:thioredoxin-dependent peroxiredoxin
MTLLKKGQSAPDFSSNDQEGNPVSISQFKGKKIILYFYPKDDTPGCTSEACNLRDNYQELRDMGFIVIGISPDNEKSHQKFSSKYSLPFHLVPDPEKTIIKSYGAWGEKKMYGKAYEGVLRTTYVISEKGLIEAVIDKVIVKDHTKQIIELINQ